MKHLPRRPATASKILHVVARALATFAALVALGVGAAHAAAPFVDNGDGTVTDTSTGLMWDQCTAGWSGAGCATGTAAIYTWANAFGLAATQNVSNYKSYSDWRLPSIVELKTLVKTGSSPTIDTAVFPNTPAQVFWSGSSYGNSSANAWYVSFFDGYLFAYGKTSGYYVRLVRGGQYFGSFALLPVGVSGTTTTTITLTTTSPVNATGYWVVAPRAATPPTPAQVLAGISYGSVTVAAAGTGAMTGKSATSFSVTGLAAGTGYDAYIVAGESTLNTRTGLVGPVQFSTLAISTSSIVIDPATPTTLYSGLDGAGVYKSTNSGGAWTASTTQPANLRVKALAIKPGDSTRLFAATYGGGVFQSTDSGVNWNVDCATQPANLNLLSLAIDASGKLYAGSEAGVFVSSDSCASWAAMSAGLP